MKNLTSQALKSLKDVSRSFYHTIIENESDEGQLSESEMYEICSSNCSNCSKGLSSYIKNSSAKSSMQKYPMIEENSHFFDDTANIFAQECKGNESDKENSQTESDEGSEGLEDEHQEDLEEKDRLGSGDKPSKEPDNEVGYLVDGDQSCEVIDRIELAER